MLRATLRVQTANAATILTSISPEAGREIPRTKVRVDQDGQDVVLSVEANDLSAMRAALNSYLRWMVIAEDMSNTIGDRHG
ncbi:MAG: Transcription factor Pcc1 [Methanomassiliicoccales archaeon PtaU1.Bin124]|nr:MAG: Transcription factor Pcc1 [Methanomassiliicoccales archaeon PtaU1.Bin124]